MTNFDAKTLSRFWAKVDVRGDDDCWLWKGARYTGGYGQFKLPQSRKSTSSHIFSFKIHHGETGGLFVCHACDNPPCCNPHHLWLGTNSDNIQDCLRKGRLNHAPAQGSLNPGAKLTESAVIEIRKMISSGVPNTQIAPLYGVTHSMVSRIKLRQAWAHLPG